MNKFKIGDEIRIVRCYDEPQLEGRTGEVTDVLKDFDGLVILYGTWASAGVYPGIDVIEKVSGDE